MLFPEEFFVKEVLPNFRILVAKKFAEKGYSQSKIARIIGVTQARVNSYFKADLNSCLLKLKEIGFEIDELNAIVDSLVYENINDPVSIIKIFRNYYLSLLATGKLCKYHMRIANLPANCDVCLKYIEPELGERQKMIKEIKEAVEMLIATKEFYFLIPEVFTNLAYALPKPESIKDVLSFPGRIIKFKNEARVISDPEFGASRHIAGMLLEANKVEPSIRACLCIKYDKKILRLLKEKGIKFAFNYTKKESARDQVIEAFKEFLSENDLPDVLIDEGGQNLEPVCYIFGQKPKDVVKLAIELSKAYFNMVIAE